ncbi:MAG: HAD-IB family hydrolase [Spirochaetes bacterium]|nr:HAD-IB family hydrolase [Spirochaetota bacterium]
MIKLAIYDIDYTLISVNSLLSFYFYIFKKFPVKIIYMPYLAFVTFLWVLRIIDTKKVKELWLYPLKDFTKDYLDKLSYDFIHSSIVPNIKPQAIQNINDHKAKGYKIFFASASFEFYINHLADYLRSDYCVGTRIIFDKDNKLSAKIDGKNCYGKEKIKRILEVINEKDILKEESVSYSDGNSDKAFLSLAKTFYKIKRKKWKIVYSVKR